MKLSIITVNLNNRNGLQKTIDSVICQTFCDFEWIVIDGGSSDGSKELIEQYANHFAYWISEPDTGIYNAMNKGISVAQGDYIQFLNSGDVLCSSNILHEVFTKIPKVDIVYGDLEINETKGVSYIQKYPDTLSLSTLYFGHIPHPSSFIKSQLLKEDPYDERLCIVSDWKFFLQKALEGRVFYHIPVVVSRFDMTGISASNIEVCNNERRIVIDELIPECIRTDMLTLNKLSSSQPDAQIRRLIFYRKHNRIYHKITTALLLLINFVGKISGRRYSE